MPAASIKLEVQTRERLQKLAQSRRRSAHWLMREAIEQYLDREEMREQARQEALESWREYQATGEHLTAEEADAWLARLEAGENARPPRTHR